MDQRVRTDCDVDRLVLVAIARANAELGTTTAIITHNSAIAGIALRLALGSITGMGLLLAPSGRLSLGRRMSASERLADFVREGSGDARL